MDRKLFKVVDKFGVVTLYNKRNISHFYYRKDDSGKWRVTMQLLNGFSANYPIDIEMFDNETDALDHISDLEMYF